MPQGGENQNIYQVTKKNLDQFFSGNFSWDQNFSDQNFFTIFFLPTFFLKKNYKKTLTKFFDWILLFHQVVFPYFFFDQNYNGPIIFWLYFSLLNFEQIFFTKLFLVTILLENVSPFLFWLELFWTKKLYF